MTLNTNQAAAAFGVSTMTIFLWRKGTATKAKLPHKVKDKRVTFDADALSKWAEKHQLEFNPKRADKPRAEAGKPGPKTRVQAPDKKPARKRTKH